MRVTVDHECEFLPSKLEMRHGIIGLSRVNDLEFFKSQVERISDSRVAVDSAESSDKWTPEIGIILSAKRGQQVGDVTIKLLGELIEGTSLTAGVLCDA